ncbi:MAG: 4-oxalocrotonate tautomerase [Hyphomicrobiales bacterium]|nr:4-oxalocrotonate tautomerase [Hyphomicrobiales bacterium]
MPITLTLTRGVLPETAVPRAVAEITQAFLAVHGLDGNSVMTPNVTAHVAILPKEASYAGGRPVEGAWIETKTPSFALADHAVQKRFFGEATRILCALSDGRLTPDRVWSNGTHTVDGTWNIDGVALTNGELGAALAAG